MELQPFDLYLGVRMLTWPGYCKTLGPFIVINWGPGTPDKWHPILLAFWAIVTCPYPGVLPF